MSASVSGQMPMKPGTIEIGEVFIKKKPGFFDRISVHYGSGAMDISNGGFGENIIRAVELHRSDLGRDERRPWYVIYFK